MHIRTGRHERAGLCLRRFSAAHSRGCTVPCAAVKRRRLRKALGLSAWAAAFALVDTLGRTYPARPRVKYRRVQGLHAALP
jgi:hypothetical protein